MADPDAVLAAATEAGFVDPSDAARYLDVEGLDSRGVKAAVGAVLRDRPHLAAPPAVADMNALLRSRSTVAAKARFDDAIAAHAEHLRRPGGDAA